MKPRPDWEFRSRHPGLSMPLPMSKGEVGHTALISGDGKLMVGGQYGPMSLQCCRGVKISDGVRRLVLAQQQQRDDRTTWIEVRPSKGRSC